jgi:hypothetical protein
VCGKRKGGHRGLFLYLRLVLWGAIAEQRHDGDGEDKIRACGQGI